MAKSSATVAPNVIASERRLLAAYGDARGRGPRAKYTIGINSILASFTYLPFWHTLISHLGYSVVVPDRSRREQFEKASLATIPAGKICLPAQAAHWRALEMIDRGAAGILMPVYKRKGQCAVLCGYGRLIESNIPAFANGGAKLICPVIDSINIHSLLEFAPRLDSVLEALAAFAPDVAPSKEEFTKALEAAFKAQLAFQEASAVAVRHAIDWLFADNSRRAVIVACHSYQIDDELLRGLDKKLTERGFAVISPLAAHLTINVEALENAEEVLRDHSSFIKHMATTSSKEANISMLFVASEHCGYDALGIAEAREILAKANRRSAALVMDPLITDEILEGFVDGFAKDISAEANRAQRESAESLSPADSIRFLMDSYEDTSGRLDVEKTLRELPNSLCHAVSRLFNHALFLLESNPDSKEVHLPPTCEDCLGVSLERLLQKRLGEPIKVHWDADWQNHFTPLEKTDAQDGGPVPEIGVIGHPLLCFDPAVVGPIAELVAELGGRMILPDPVNMRTNERGYSEQLDAYKAAGADGVIYLQDRDCLKDFVSGFGTVSSIQDRYNPMQIVAMEYDNEFPYEKLYNRVSLIVDTAKHRLSQA